MHNSFIISLLLIPPFISLIVPWPSIIYYFSLSFIATTTAPFIVYHSFFNLSFCYHNHDLLHLLSCRGHASFLHYFLFNAITVTLDPSRGTIVLCDGRCARPLPSPPRVMTSQRAGQWNIGRVKQSVGETVREGGRERLIEATKGPVKGWGRHGGEEREEDTEDR